MRRSGYLYDQPAKDAAHMNLDMGAGGEASLYIDTPETNRQALTDLLDSGGLMVGDTLVVTALSKLGHGKGSARQVGKVEALGASVEVSPSPLKLTNLRRKKRGPKPDQLAYLNAIWTGSVEPDAAIAQATRHMGFPVDRNWMTYHVCQRDGGLSTKAKKEAE